MIGKTKNQAAILQKLGIEALNPMQEEARATIMAHPETILLSPTGTGKTLAFLLPLLSGLDDNLEEVQALILVPSRELAIQIEQVIREMGSGYKVNAVYGGRASNKDKQELKTPPAILVGTPGRVADHLRRGTFTVDHLTMLVLDEFDKSLETGFEGEMTEIVEALPHLAKKILTSATQQVEIPNFVGLKNPKKINYLDAPSKQLTLKTVESPRDATLDTLVQLIRYLGDANGIVFCNFKDTIQEVSTFLRQNGIAHSTFYGGMEQQDRERALIKFRNGSSRVLLATDLAARGIDVPELDFIIHYQIPHKLEEFTHRNGRTARMHSDGTAYVIKWEERELPEFITGTTPLTLPEAPPAFQHSDWTTLFISGGRKDKISKGDIAGLFFKQGGLKKDELGTIELKQDCAFVAVPSKKAGNLVLELNNSRLKKKKVRISTIG